MHIGGITRASSGAASPVRHALALASLPYHAADAEPDHRSRDPGRPILVVDDDAKIVSLVQTYLEREGFAVVTAATAPPRSMP